MCALEDSKETFLAGQIHKKDIDKKPEEFATGN